MHKTHQDVLKEINHYIEYKFDVDNNIAYIYISWKDITYYIKYDNDEVYSSYDERFFKIDKYCIKSLVYSILNKICKEYKYPTRWVIYKINDNNINNIVFDVVEYENESNQSEDLYDITKEFLQIGLRQDHILEAKEFNLKSGMELVINYNLNLTTSIE